MLILLFFAVILGANSMSFWKSAVKTLRYMKVWKTNFPIFGSIRLKMSEPVTLLLYNIMGKWFRAYRIRNSEFFAWDRNSYLTHVISFMGRIEKENHLVDSVCIGCIERHVTLSLGWNNCDVTITSNLKMSYADVNFCGEANWAASWQNQQCGYALSEDSDQPGHPPSLIKIFA